MLDTEKVKNHFKRIQKHDLEAEFYVALLFNERFCDLSQITEKSVQEIGKSVLETNKNSILDEEVLSIVDRVLKEGK